MLPRFGQLSLVLLKQAAKMWDTTLSVCISMICMLFGIKLKVGAACKTQVVVTLAFGGKSWPISAQDMNRGALTRGSSTCLGSIFDLNAGTNIPVNSGNPNWVVGDTFLVSIMFFTLGPAPSVNRYTLFPSSHRKTYIPYIA